MKSLQTKSKHSINNHYKTYRNYHFKKAILNDAELPLSTRVRLTKDIFKTYSVCSVKHRCIISNRARALVTPFKLSRIKFRERASFGLIMGVRKGAW